ncbi:MAG: VapC toxin family PIN domain ribonuclease [Verrucomicrobia bacterium]|nr:VapC toxin family PIN domain ribonuclease [Verrucomicrobiota bacterium]MCH8513052.1 VapC toxin family PIN domain ribonuclease [Kiritimatiellia bacterium]
MILVDTSIWIDHFRKTSPNLVGKLKSEQVVMHDFVLGELACGNLTNRKEIIALLHALPHVNKIQDDEILLFVEQHALMGRGIGLIDIHLLASSILDRCALWTRDKRLLGIAEEMGIAFRHP